MYSIASSHTKIENQLQNEEKTLKSIFNFSPLGIALLNTEKQIVSFNINLKNTLSKITNLEININQNILNYFPENEQLNFENYFNLARDGRIIRIEKNFKSEYTSFWFDITFSPVLGNNKVFHNIVLTLVDITKRKQLEIDAQIAKDKAEMANASKSHFMSTMSKEIRTPMNEIIGITQGLISENPRQDQIDHLKVLVSSSENLSNLINDILNYDNIEASKANLKHLKIKSQTNQENE
jgi:PAS domain S-box-containing protein